MPNDIDYDPVIRTPWLVLDVTGQWCLLALLVTYALAKNLPQRNNPFLINFILTTYLASIPPALLLYTNKQFEKVSMGLCFVQFALMSGVGPMFAIAQMVLVFDTWSELRSSCLQKPHISRKRVVKYMLIAAPYICMCIWSIASLGATIDSHATPDNAFAYCKVGSPAANRVYGAVGLFITFVAFIGLFFELWVCWMIYSYPTKVQKDPLVWRTNIQFAARVLIYSLLLFLVVALSVLNIVVEVSEIKATYQLLNSTNALFAFLVFGTQKSVLRVWKFWDRRGSSDYPEDLEQQLHGDPRDWAHIPAQLPPQYHGDREKGQPEPQYLKAWLRLTKR